MRWVLTKNQRRFVDSLIDCMAGHVLYSAITGRYGKEAKAEMI